MNQRGTFIVIYGVNNLGKTTQAQLLVNRLQKDGSRAEYIKYPIYNLAPSGPLINEYLRAGNPQRFSPREIQLLYVLNRTQFEPALKAKLAAGIHIVAEDYVGTGIAWGVGGGVPALFLKKLNEHLIKEDSAFLFEGERFTAATEANHAHETNEPLLDKVRLAHRQLGAERGWRAINANRPREEIHEEIWVELEKFPQ